MTLYQFNHSINLNEFNKYEYLKNDVITDKEEKIIGRIMYLMPTGNLLFIRLLQNQDNLQLLVSKKNIKSDLTFKNYIKQFNVGDYLGVSGYPYRSQRGELSLMVNHIDILAKCQINLPSFNHESGGDKPALVDLETRFRNRSLDFLVNYKKKNIFIIRNKIIQFIRNYYLQKDFIEVETPSLHTIYGGAIAKPFETELNHLKLKMALRIAPEIYLKKLIIGGFEKVFEIGKQFRNESMDDTHNPEFTSLESYQVGFDYNNIMEFTEDLLSKLILHINNSYLLSYQDKIINFTPPFRRIDMIPYLEEKINQKINIDSSDLNLQLLSLCHKYNINVKVPTNSKMLDKLVGHFIEIECTNPTFIINHPQLMSPLTRQHRTIPHLSERFELFVNQFELANAYSELNDPDYQLKMFQEQIKDKNIDDETTPIDYQFIEDMKLGMPPTGGLGIGIDRLIMLLTNNISIREVLLFPTLKPL